jgi:hypothetical protein
MAMKEIKKIDVLSTAIMYGLTLAVIGLIIGLFAGLFMFIAGSMAGAFVHEFPVGRGLGAGMGIAAVIFFPILYGALGFVFGALGAFLYNLIANWVGGVKIEIKDLD